MILLSSMYLLHCIWREIHRVIILQVLKGKYITKGGEKKCKPCHSKPVGGQFSWKARKLKRLPALLSWGGAGCWIALGRGKKSSSALQQAGEGRACPRSGHLSSAPLLYDHRQKNIIGSILL